MPGLGPGEGVAEFSGVSSHHPPARDVGLALELMLVLDSWHLNGPVRPHSQPHAQLSKEARLGLRLIRGIKDKEREMYSNGNWTLQGCIKQLQSNPLFRKL